MIMLWEVGISAPEREAWVVTLTAYAALYPSRFMIGIMTPPMADVSATGEPDTPPNRVDATTLARPRPPFQWPTRLRAKLTILSAMPPCSINSPEKMKKGMARKE